jgi:hypothetical protein
MKRSPRDQFIIKCPIMGHPSQGVLANEAIGGNDLRLNAREDVSTNL